MVLIVHVDDMVQLRTAESIRQLQETLCDFFEMKWTSMNDTVFVGLHIRRIRERKIILVSQEKHVLEMVIRFGL